MSKKCCCKSHSHKLESCGCPTPRMCCGTMAVPTTAYNMVSVPQMVYDNVPASAVAGANFNQYPSHVGGYGGHGGYDEGCGSGIIIIIIILLLCCGNGFGGSHGGHDDDCGFGDSSCGSIIIIIILILCFCGNGFGY
ncbi:DUF3309 family protein [Clostridium cylindrosporum]|uniref:Uncharacterized protein n=1 Tax=Clostridium cylindrosporum DSM 605 TaxID=1121307 RepID=A0A0J8DET6_CLOCY|nr:DUF3309 family protein [Clostridium cylindrosporum]KMT22749.1 hypothetical protein CLCY_11c00830 [Clostridium cylindrosporum DSM 605]